MISTISGLDLFQVRIDHQLEAIDEFTDNKA
jgi:hypothetical protein